MEDDDDKKKSETNLNSDNLIEEIMDVISTKLDIKKEKISLQSSFRNDLGVDSLDTFSLIYEMEEKWGIAIPDEVVNKLETVGDVYNFLHKELEKKNK